MNADKDRRQELKKSYKESEVKKNQPPPISSEEYERLIRYLDKVAVGDEDGLNLTIEFLENNSLPVPEILSWLQSLGCYDDYEVLTWGLFVIEPLPTKNN